MTLSRLFDLFLAPDKGIPLMTSFHTLPVIPAASARTWRNASIMQRKGPGPFRGSGRRKDGKNKPPPPRNYRTIHGRNIRLFAAPLIFIFAVLRTLAYQLWVVLVVIGCRSRQALTLYPSAESNKTADEEAPCLGTPMASNDKRQGVGPGEPALASQKHHHRKAFEHISKALKIDEEDSGMRVLTLHPVNTIETDKNWKWTRPSFFRG
jgi:hypothetical protein